MKIWDSSFELGDAVTDEQLAFFKEHGVIVFRNFLQKEQVATYIAEQQRLETQWLAEKKEKVNGIPLKFGKDDKGNTTIQRLCFSSLHSEPLQQLLADQRLQALTAFLHPYDGRIAENEKDGLVINNYINFSFFLNKLFNVCIPFVTTWTLSNPLSLDGNVAFGGSTNIGTLTLAGNATLTGGRTFAIDSPVNMSGVLSGDFDWVKTGAAELTLAGANTALGVLTVTGGTLSLSGGAALAAQGPLRGRRT